MVKASGVQGMSIETTRYPSLRWYNAAGTLSTVLGADPESGSLALYTSRALGSGEFFIATEIGENIPKWRLNQSGIFHYLPTYFTPPSGVPVTVDAIAGNDIQQWATASQTYAAVAELGRLWIRSNGIINGASLSVATGYDSAIGMIVRGNSNTQSADLSQWVKSDNTLLAKVDKDGKFTTPGVTVSGFTAAGVVHNNASGVLSSSLIVNADIDSSAAIAQGKIYNLVSDLSSKETPSGAQSKADAAKSAAVSDAATSAAALYVTLASRGSANGVATLDASGLVPTSQIPPIAISDTFTPSNETQMLALTAQVGDVAIRSDINKTFILQAAPASTLSNWKEILTPPGVSSVTAASPLTAGGVANGSITTTGTIGIQDASTSQKGAVKLEDSITSTSTATAATPNSVKSAYNKATALAVAFAIGLS